MKTNDWQKSWKKQLDQYDSPVDSSLFEAITSKAAVKSSNPFFFGWIGTGLVVLTSILIISALNSQSSHYTEDTTLNAVHHQASISENKSGKDLFTSSLFYPSISYELNNTGRYVATKNQEKKVIATPSSKEVASGQMITSQPKLTIQNSRSGLIASSVSSKINSIADLVLADNSYASENTALSTENDNKITTEISFNPEKIDFKFQDANVRLNATRPLSVLFPVKSRTAGLRLNMPDPESCYSFNDARGRSSFYVDAYVGAGNSIRSLSAIENQGPYMHLRDSLEKSWYNSAAGARIGFILASGMAIETGAEFQVHNEIFEYKNESEVRITYKYHYDQFGTVTRIDTITEIGARTLRTHNKYQQITIPLRLGYTMEKGKWMIGARLGVGLHIWNHQNGVILDNTYQTYVIEEDPEGYFNKNWGMQYNASIQIGYRILPQTFLMIEPIWNSQSSGITQRPYTIEQKYQTLRLNIGVRFVPGSY